MKPPPSISHIQWPDMHDWEERGAVGDAAWEQWHPAKLAEIVTVVESDESRRFAGEIKTLEDLLRPTVSEFAADARIRQSAASRCAGGEPSTASEASSDASAICASVACSRLPLWSSRLGWAW